MSETPPARPAAAVPRRLRQAALGATMAAACVAVAGFFVLPYFVRPQGERLLSESLGRPVKIDEVRINPFRLSAEFRGVHVRGGEGAADLFSAKAVDANLEAVSLIKGGAVLSELRVDGPQLKLQRLADGSDNWSDVLTRLTAGDDQPPPLFSVNNIRVSGGSIELDDRRLGLHHELTDLTLGIPFLSNLPVKVDVFVEPSLSARLNGNPVALSGRTKPFSAARETALDLDLEGVELSSYIGYLPFRPAFRVPSGRLTTHLSLAFAQPAGSKPTVTLKGSLQLNDLEIQDASGTPAIRLPEAAVDLTDVQPLERKWHFARLRLQAPELDVERLAGGGINLAALLPAGKRAAGEGKAAPVDFLLESAKVRDGRVRFTDHGMPTLFRGELQDIAVDLRNLATTAGEPADLLVDFTTDGGEKLSFQDRLRVVPFELEGTASIDNLQPARYAAYLSALMPGGELRGGRVDGLLHYRWSSGAKQADSEIVAETLSLRDLELVLKTRRAPVLAVAAADARDVSVKPFGRALRIGDLGVRGAQASLVRSADGRLDLATLLGPESRGPRQAAWKVAVDRIKLEGGSVRLEDRTTAAPTVIAADDIAFAVDKLDTAGAPATVDLTARVGEHGNLTAAGTIAPAPLKADLRVALERLALKPLQGYLVEGLKVAVGGGNLDARGRLAVDSAGDGALKMRLHADADVTDFSAMDRGNGATLLRWRKLRAGGADVQLAPFAVSLDEIAVNGFYSRLVLDDQGRLNLRDLRAGSPSAAAEGTGVATAELAPVSKALPPLRIGKVSFRDGRVAFSDHFVRPNYDATLTAVEGSLTGLSTDPASMAQLTLQGRVDGDAPVAVTGRLNPFRDDRYLDISASVRDFDLPAVSTYSGKYIGYGIERGKLSAELSYKVEQRRLTASNRVFVDQLTFGKRVDSPDALNIPVQLGVALLKNPRGQIDLDLPVSGSLDDPRFSVVGLLFKAFGNLLVKAATAPFTMLSALLDNGTELSYVDFVPGVAVIDSGMRQKLSALAQALQQRPALRLEITGRADPRADAEGLRQALLQDALRALKRRDLASKGESAAGPLVVSAEDYPGLLKRLYQQAKFDKPRNFFGVVRDLPAAQMEAMMLANIQVGDADLERLARRRADVVRDWLVGEGGIAPERVFVLAPKVATGAPGENGRRTDFSLR